MPTPNRIEFHTGPAGYDAVPFDKNGWNESLGPFESGGFRYFAYARESGVNPFTLAVARTSDGVTFTVLDTAHAPALSTLNNKLGAVALVGSVLWIAYHDPGDTLNLVSFDMTTNLYGTVFVGPSPAKPYDVFQLVALSGGGFVVLLGASPFLANGFYFVTVTGGGVFGALTALALSTHYSDTATSTLSAAADAANGLHGIYNVQVDLVPTWQLHYFRIFGGAVVADSVLTTGSNFWAENASPNGVGKYIAASDTMAFPVMDVNAAKLLNVVFVANASTAPVVTTEAVAAGSLALLNSPSFLVAGMSYVFSYLSYDLPVATKEQILTFTRPSSGGPWVAGPLVYDSVVNPPSPAPSFITQLAPMNLTPLLSGLFGTVLGFGFPAASSNVMYYLEAALALAPVAGPNPTPVSGGGPPKYTPARPGPVVDLHPVKSECAECTCDTILDLVLMQSDLLLLD